MNVKALADLTGLNMESIRMYRNQGFLKPEQKSNGYYDYKIEDLISLLYYRKLREFHYPMARIQSVYEADSMNEIRKLMEEQEEQLQMELRDMQARLNHLQIAKRHLQIASGSVESSAWLYDIAQEKVDLLDLRDLAAYKDHFSAFAPGIHVAMEDLNGPDEDRVIPMQACMGTFVDDLVQLKIPIPHKAVYIPGGTNLFQIIELSGFTDFHLSRLADMRRYAKEHDLIFTSDLTGGLINVHKSKEGFHYIFTVRACVKPRGL